jgi:hypothetical protein
VVFAASATTILAAHDLLTKKTATVVLAESPLFGIASAIIAYIIGLAVSSKKSD